MPKVFDRSIGYITIRELHARHDDLYSYDIEAQRNFVWDEERMNLLINSILSNFTINTMYVNRREEKKRVIDGQNRIKTIVTFLNGEWRLSDNFIYQIKDEDGDVIESHDFSKMKFLDLPSEYQNMIKNYNIISEEFYNLTDDEENELCFRLNRGKTLSVISETRMLARGEIQRFVTRIAKTSFFDRKVNITESSKDDFIHEVSIYNILLFEMELEEKIALKNTKKFVQYAKENELLTEDIQNIILKTIIYLDESFPSKHKFLIFKNIVPVYLLAKVAIEDGINPRDFVDMFDKFYIEENNIYEKKYKKTYQSTEVVMKQFEELKKYYTKHIVKK